MDKLKEKCFQAFLASEYPADPIGENSWRDAHMRKAFIAGWDVCSGRLDVSSFIKGKEMDDKQETQKKWVVFGSACWEVVCVPITRTDRPGVWRIVDSYDLPGGKYTGGYVKDGDNAFDSEQEALEKAIEQILPVRNQLNSQVDRLMARLASCIVGEGEVRDEIVPRGTV